MASITDPQDTLMKCSFQRNQQRRGVAMAEAVIVFALLVPFLALLATAQQKFRTRQRLAYESRVDVTSAAHTGCGLAQGSQAATGFANLTTVPENPQYPETYPHVDQVMRDSYGESRSAGDFRSRVLCNTSTHSGSQPTQTFGEWFGYGTSPIGALYD